MKAWSPGWEHWEVMEPLEVLSERSVDHGGGEHAGKGDYRTQASSWLFFASRPCSNMHSHCDVILHHRLKVTGLTNHRLETSKLGTKTTQFSLYIDYLWYVVTAMKNKLTSKFLTKI